MAASNIHYASDVRPYSGVPRVFLWALALGPCDSGGVCYIGPHLVYGKYLVCIRVLIRGPIRRAYRKTLGGVTLGSPSELIQSSPYGKRVNEGLLWKPVKEFCAPHSHFVFTVSRFFTVEAPIIAKIMAPHLRCN